MTNSLDFIGDVHGHCDELRALLAKLGYVESSGAFRYPGGERSVVFLGDYVDRGPKVRETLNLVRSMRDAGSAIALMGNHEFNMLSFWQKNGAGGGHSLLRFKDGYLREHSFNKVAIHSRTVSDFVGRRQEFEEALEFVKTLQFYVETPTFRAQHACFDTDAVEALRREGITCFADGNFDVPLNWQSKGTLKYIRILDALYDMITGSHVYYLDELGENLHNDLLYFYLNVFIFNSDKSQLIITSQETTLLSQDLINENRGVVWFVDKNKETASSTYSRGDSFGLHKNLSLYNSYRIGRLGAKPELGSIFINLDD